MRITGGTHRSRILSAPEGRDIRPTSDKVRQAVFNMLASRGLPDENTVALDAFCGTGALGLEALSRGARRAVFMDNSAASAAACRANIKALGLEGRAELLTCDATQPGVKPAALPEARLVFLDPPYRDDVITEALAALAAGGWLAPGALCVAEQGQGTAASMPPGFALLDTRRYGETQIALCRYEPITPA